MKLTDLITAFSKEDRKIKHPIYKWSRYLAGFLFIFFAIGTFVLVFLNIRAGLQTPLLTLTVFLTALSWTWTQVVVMMKKRGMIE